MVCPRGAEVWCGGRCRWLACKWPTADGVPADADVLSGRADEQACPGQMVIRLMPRCSDVLCYCASVCVEPGTKCRGGVLKFGTLV